ncbi:protein-disulfide reductase DsbD domain-containing protein [Ancylobacter terrae]|uniref:protein-disulfide reductase DsbD domain-containing protein n=1 Tax=Ancylobacter sp. sgz301288 TaxID=3342077 RepID=UPI00385D130B
MRLPCGGLALAVALCLAAPVSPARAGAESEWSSPSGTGVRLMAGGSGEAIAGGIEIRLAPGWKTYWRYPGDSGVPPRFDWSGSTNVASVEVEWPAPMRFEDGSGSFSIGYKRDVILPFRVVPKVADQPVALRLGLDFAVCEKICQPAFAQLALELPAGGGTPHPAVVAAEAAVPDPAPIAAPGATGIDAVTLDAAGGPPTIRVEARVADGARADLFVEGPNEDWALPLPSREDLGNGRARFTLPVDGVPRGADIRAATLRLTLIDAGRAIEVTSPLSGR